MSIAIRRATIGDAPVIAEFNRLLALESEGNHIYRTATADPTVVGLRLYVEQDNHPAQQTYRRLGMEPMNFFLFHKFPLREQP